MAIGLTVSTLWYVTNRKIIRSSIDKTISERTGADITIITGEGGMPPDTSPGQLLVGEQFTIVFTEPFPSLEKWQESKEVKQISTTSGTASIDLPAGKYGVYYIYKGEKKLYSDLNIDNAKSNVQMDKQGPWYIKIGTTGKTKLNFSVNSLAV